MWVLPRLNRCQPGPEPGQPTTRAKALIPFARPGLSSAELPSAPVGPGAAYAGGMPGVIDSRHWLRQRIGHLEELLRNDPPPEQRQAIEAELAQAREELRRSAGWVRWLLWGARR
jgi:hypothetical protein